MRTRTSLVALVLGAALLAAGADAEAPTGYLPAPGLQVEALLPAPPAPGSPAQAADEARFAETRALEGSARWALAAADADSGSDPMLRSFGCALGAQAGAASTPRLTRLVDRLKADGDLASEGLKARFARPRPPVTHPDAPLCIPRAAWMGQSPSYPSGHAMAGWATALVLAEIAPARSGAVLARGREIGDSRVICGVHYQTDVEAGRLLGAALVARLHAEPAFQADLAAARAELAAAPPQACGT